MTTGRVPSVPRHLSVLFADDIRQEVGGKLTIVGIYQDQMLLPSLPTTLPKLAVLMTATTPKQQPFKKAIFKLLRNSEVIHSFEIPEEGLQDQHAKSEGSKSLAIETQYAVIIPGIRIESPCVIQTTLETETEELAGRDLEIGQLPELKV